MPTFQKKSLQVEAIACSDAIQYAKSDWKALPTWLADAYEKGDIIFTPTRVSINTLEGLMWADRTDWIIQGIKGEIYPCKAHIFEATYDRIG